MAYAAHKVALMSRSRSTRKPPQDSNLSLSFSLSLFQPTKSLLAHLFANTSPSLGNPNLLHDQPNISLTCHFSAHSPFATYLNPASIVSFVVLPSSFSSLFIRIAAAETPMKSAKMGSVILEIRYGGGAGDILWEWGC
jgi:hypothetical protein